MPCKTVTIDAPDVTDISIKTMGANGGTNSGSVSYTLGNSGNTAGTVTVEVSVDGSSVNTQSYTVYPGTNTSDTIGLSFDVSSTKDVQVCASIV